MGGAWLMQTLWERYLFTQDKEYLQSTVYPLMKGAADFCQKWTPVLSMVVGIAIITFWNTWLLT
ncbi:MAG: hypothetical protein II751_04205, partial [Bacteroidales bacterium]|nr:hypothetical protein [Bacteroidales bacterium]